MLRRIALLLCLLVLPLVRDVSAAQPMSKATFDRLRNKMVDDEIVAAGVKDPRVIRALRDTPRHEFVALRYRNEQAYLDMALPIGEAQTISPPFIVAYMTESLDPQPEDKVLEIGTGSGYQAAVLAPLASQVYTIEIVEKLGHHAERTLKRLHYDNVHVKIGDGFLGWPEEAPFDKIIVTCSPEKVPPALVAQLREGGRMVIPVGERYQQTLKLMRKEGGKLKTETLLPVIFVPMTGKAEDVREVQPDPAHPSIRNGGFEEVSGEPPMVVGWHYQRQVKVQSGRDAPQGQRYVTLSNTTPGRNAHIMQGFAIDGRKVSDLELSFEVRGKDLRPNTNVPRGTEPDLPLVIVMFYDKNRGSAGKAVAGPWRDSFGWQHITQKIKVPKAAREAMLQVGLLGATGEISFDDFQLKVVK
jgi:protein-L-isoaspartate(D-aspartate) O-methyltransferase